MANLSAIINLLEAPAKGLLTLEGQNTTCADVFFVWVTIAWHLERLLSDPSSSLHTHRSRIIKIYNDRFKMMMRDSDHYINLLGYFLHPRACCYDVAE